jgi:adenosylcobinamide-GDP ribazoletransferase
VEVIRALKCSIAFLTRMPVGMDSKTIPMVSKHIYLFPVIGGFIGLIGGAVAVATCMLDLGPIVGILTLGSILLITGLHHTDGLLDFGDGLMALGTREERIKVMRDTAVGTGGVATGFIVLAATALTISEIPLGHLLGSMVVSESSAKLGMVFGAKLGKSSGGGLASAFLDSMRGRSGWGKSLVAFVLCVVIAAVWRQPVLLIGLVAAAISGIVVCQISNSSFGALTGDGLGAINEFARMASLVAIMGAIRWI